MTPSFAVVTKEENLISAAKELAAYLDVPFTQETEAYEYLLELSSQQLSLMQQHSSFKPLFVDFQSREMKHRCKLANFRNEILVKALGLKKNSATSIVDATGGLGRDSFILAYLGFNVTVLERSRLIYVLLKNGLERGLNDPTLQPSIQRITLLQADAIQWLKALSIKPDVIYLDPMFPERKKKAAVKKEMQIFQAIIGSDADESELLSSALACAAKRVVVKRPRLAKAIDGPPPSYALSGSSSRFDIYLI